MKIYSFVTILFILPNCLISHAFGARNSNNRDYITLTTYYTHFSDLKKTGEETEKSIAPSFEVEAGLRIRGLFQIIFVGSQATDNKRESFGGGMRIDTPGIFWIGGGQNQNYRATKNFPVNTSIFSYLLRSSVKNNSGIVTTYTGSNMGIAFDVFLFNRYIYFSTQGSILNEQGNAYTTYSIGLGANF